MMARGLFQKLRAALNQVLEFITMIPKDMLDLVWYENN